MRARGWGGDEPCQTLPGARLVPHVEAQGTVRETRPVQCGRTHPCVLQWRVWVVRPCFQQQDKGVGEKQRVRGPCCLLALIPQANCMRLCTLLYPEGLFSLLERCRAMPCLPRKAARPRCCRQPHTAGWHSSCASVGVCAWCALHGGLCGACMVSGGGALVTVGFQMLQEHSTTSARDSIACPSGK